MASMRRGAVIAGLDIGGTKVAVVLADGDGTICHRSQETTDVASSSLDDRADRVIYHGIAEQAVRMVRSGLDALGRPTLAAVGIVSAGPIRDGGLWSPPNIVPTLLTGSRRQRPRAIPLVAPLRAAFGCPVLLQNDCNGAVLGEVFDGLGRDVADKTTLYLAYVTLSTGFGAGVWDGGHLILGKDGNAGEIGHILVHEGGPLCGCGNRGCVEAYASGSGIARGAAARLREGSPSGSSGPLRRMAEEAAARSSLVASRVALDFITAEMVFRASAAGDPIASQVIDDAAYASGIAFSAIANAYDPETISVGGSVALTHPELIGRIRGEMLRHLNVRAPDVCLTPLGSAVTEHGALAIARSLLAAA